MGLRERVEARLTALIAPNVPTTDSERAAFDVAVELQMEYETEHAQAVELARRGVSGFTAGNYSETYRDARAADIGPDARAVLLNAGLLRRRLPCARRL